MVTSVKNKDGQIVPSFSFPSIWDNAQAETLRDALIDILQNIVGYKEPKECTRPYSLFLITEMIDELTKDVDILNKKGGQDD